MAKHSTNNPTRMSGKGLPDAGSSRVEGLSDGVFALAIAILLISSNVPKSFSELLAFVYDLPSFGICMLFIFWIWRSQVIFIRRYGLTEPPTLYYHLALLILVLFYVYPLKFLMTWLVKYFSLLLAFLFVDKSYGADLQALSGIISFEDMPWLMIIYGMGFLSIFLIFARLYRQVLRNADQFQLSEEELLESRYTLRHYRVMVISGALSVSIALLGYLFHWVWAGLMAGMAYNLIWIMVIVLGKQYRRAVAQLRLSEAAQESD